MSTRAGIVLIDESGDTLHFYRHYDGYPKGTMPTLKKFLNLVKKGQIRDNVGQAGGWLVLIGAMEYNEAVFYKCKKCGKEHSDSEFLKWDKKKEEYVCRDCGHTEATSFRKQMPLETIFNPKAKGKSTAWKVGAYEPTTNVQHHGDLEFVYVIDLKEKKIITHKGGSQNFKIPKAKKPAKKLTPDLIA